MTRGESTQTKVHYKGSNDDFVIFVDDPDQYEKWVKGDTAIPLAQFMSSFRIFHTHGQGPQGKLDAAPKNILDAEFGTTDEDEVIKQILKKGSKQTVEMPGRQGATNDSMSSMRQK